MKAPLYSTDSLFDVEIPTRFHVGIESGNVICIIKRGRRNVKLGKATMGSSISGCGMNVDIRSLRICRFRDMHMGDARAAGFSSTLNMITFLKSVYKDIKPMDELTQIQFRYLGSIVGRRR